MRLRLAAMNLSIGVALLLATDAGAAGFVGIGAHMSDIKASDAQEGKRFVGGQLRLALGHGFGVEASVDYRVDTFRSDSPYQEVTVKSVPLLFSLTAEIISQSPVTPYVLGGGGFYFSSLENKTDLFTIQDDQTRFGYHAGAGIVVKPAPRIAIHVDFRYTAVDFELKDLKIETDGRMITAGATFYF